MAQEKISFDFPSSPFPFIPPVEELFKWLGGPEGLHTFLHRMYQDLDGVRSPDLQTLRRACREGVTPRIANKIQNDIYAYAGLKNNGTDQQLEQIEQSVQRFIDRGVRPGTNGAKWIFNALAWIKGLKFPIDLTNTIAYLETREKEEHKLFGSVREVESAELPIGEKIRLIHEIYKSILLENTLINSEDVDVFCGATVDLFRPHLEEKPKFTVETETMGNILRSHLSLKMDFYHQLLANFMKDMLEAREQLNLTPNIEKALIEHGSMGRLLPEVEHGKLVTPTEKTYRFWKVAFCSSEEEHLSFRSMADHMPDPDSARTRSSEEKTGEERWKTVRETKIRRLKQWRNSSTIPKSEQLKEFLENLSGDKHGGAFLPFMMTRIATAWTKWAREDMELIENAQEEVPAISAHLDTDWFIEAFSRYPEYWRVAATQQGW